MKSRLINETFVGKYFIWDEILHRRLMKHEDQLATQRPLKTVQENRMSQESSLKALQNLKRISTTPCVKSAGRALPVPFLEVLSTVEKFMTWSSMLLVNGASIVLLQDSRTLLSLTRKLSLMQ